MTVVTEWEGRLFIDGEFREARSGNRYDVVNPADETIIGSAADAGTDDVDDAIQAARRVFDETDWSTDHAFRKRCMVQLKDALVAHIKVIGEVQTAEAGICSWVMPAFVDSMIEGMDYFTDLIDTFEWITELPPSVNETLQCTSTVEICYEPYGVVGAIIPWNSPFQVAIWKVHHALATGNTVVLKSAPDTPLTGALLAKIAAEHTDIPAGALNVLSAEDKGVVGDAMTGDPRIDLFHFTGSPGVGQRIAERAAVGIRHTVLELGGKSANIVLPDADLNASCMRGVGFSMANSGQGCALGTRMIVHADVYDDVVAQLTAMIGAVKWGDPTEPGVTVGPIIRKDQVDRIDGMVKRAADEGARIAVGGEIGDRGGKGSWYLPTLVVDVDENSEIAQNEVFGPVLSVIRYEGDDSEAVRIANNTRYGLSGYVQSGDPERALSVARRLRTGTVNINQAFFMAPDVPFSGWGISGDGVEHGIAGFREYLRLKSVARET